MPSVARSKSISSAMFWWRRRAGLLPCSLPTCGVCLCLTKKTENLSNMFHSRGFSCNVREHTILLSTHVSHEGYPPGSDVRAQASTINRIPIRTSSNVNRRISSYIIISSLKQSTERHQKSIHQITNPKYRRIRPPPSRPKWRALPQWPLHAHTRLLIPPPKTEPP
jgi:hypothetical protein